MGRDAVVVWERIGGFCEEYVGYGAEDTDVAWAAVTRGARQGWLDEFERLGLAVRTSYGWERSTRTSGPDRSHPSGCDICAEP